MSNAQQIAVGTVDRIINLHAANPNRSREWLAETVGLTKAVEEMEALAELSDLAGPIENHNLKRWFIKALAALKGEKA